MAANLGISAACMVHVAVAGLGLGALMAAHPLLFDAVRWLGVLYLLWLAWRSLAAAALPHPPQVSAAGAFRQGMLVNLTNPKVILFVLAFIPQFVDPARPVLAQFLIFGGLLSLGGFVVNGAAGLAGGGLAARLLHAPGLARTLGRISAAIFAALALRLAFLSA
jgi:threonine/homoserine/homoserine lactone efflux protein